MLRSSFVFFFFFKQKTAYEMRISDWSSDVCSSDLRHRHPTTARFAGCGAGPRHAHPGAAGGARAERVGRVGGGSGPARHGGTGEGGGGGGALRPAIGHARLALFRRGAGTPVAAWRNGRRGRSEERRVGKERVSSSR